MLQHKPSKASNIRVETFIGSEITPYIDALAHLRITIFREYPYLYEGSLVYEKRYLSKFANSNQSLVIILFDGDRVVGALSAVPLSEEAEEVKAPFIAQGIDTSHYLYLSEVLFLKEYRGLKKFPLVYKQFCHYVDQNRWIKHIMLLTIDRKKDDPRMPAGYRSLDLLWERHGFRIEKTLSSEMSYREIGESKETPKPFLCWVKDVKTS